MIRIEHMFDIPVVAPEPTIPACAHCGAILEDGPCPDCGLCSVCDCQCAPSAHGMGLSYPHGDLDPREWITRDGEWLPVWDALPLPGYGFSYTHISTAFGFSDAPYAVCDRWSPLPEEACSSAAEWPLTRAEEAAYAEYLIGTLAP